MLNSKTLLKPTVNLAIILIVLTGCDMSLKKEIRAYKGDGYIEYIKRPHILATSGVLIKMPPFDLSKPLSVEYSLINIPKGYPYIIYLNVPTPCPLEDVLKGAFNVKLKNNNKTIIQGSSVIKRMRNTATTYKNRFYFDSGYEPGDYVPYIDIKESEQDYSLFVTHSNDSLKESVEAYISISRGGYK